MPVLNDHGEDGSGELKSHYTPGRPPIRIKQKIQKRKKSLSKAICGFITCCLNP